MDRVARRARARPRGDPPPQFHPAGRVPLRRRDHVPGRRADRLRLRQLPGRPRHAAGGDRLRRLRGATRGGARRGAELGLGIACYVEGTGIGPYEGARDRRPGRRHRDRRDRAVEPGPGPPDDPRPDRRRRARRADGAHPGHDRRHPPAGVGRGHVREPHRGRRRQRRPQGRGRGPQAGGRADRRHPRGRSRGPRVRRRRDRGRRLARPRHPARPARRDGEPAPVRVRRGVGRGGAAHPAHVRVAGGPAPGRDDAGPQRDRVLQPRLGRVRLRHARGRGGDRRGDLQRADPALRRPARLRAHHQPHDRRRADVRRDRAGDRRRAVRADGLRRRGPAAERELHGLPDALRDRGPGARAAAHRDAVAQQRARGSRASARRGRSRSPRRSPTRSRTRSASPIDTMPISPSDLFELLHT